MPVTEPTLRAARGALAIGLAAGALALAHPAAAAVTYDFSFTNLGNGVGDFSLEYVEPDYITTTGFAPGAAQPTTLGFDVLKFGENSSGVFQFSGGGLGDAGWGFSSATFEFLPEVLRSGYITSPGQFVGVLNGAASGEFFAGDAILTVTETGVPEPTTWALMISGFGLAGVALRRRRLTVSPA